jgi:ribosomal-protein-alanine N-acetyltransferase
MDIPEIQAEDLLLRPFNQGDAAQVAEYCGDWEVARTTINIPHPYDPSMAEEWISTHQEAYDNGASLTLAITRHRQLVGAIALTFNKTHHSAEMGYWIGQPHWNRGYATKAARSLIRYAFESMELNRIHARHMTTNPSSGRVMEKVGMTHEGILRQSIFRWDKYEDAAHYSILRDEIG